MQWTYVEPYTQQLENTHSTKVQHELQNQMYVIPQSESQLVPKKKINIIQKFSIKIRHFS